MKTRTEYTKPVPLDDGPEAIGKAWLDDSSLERWFPITADELARLKSERDELRAVLVAASRLVDALGTTKAEEYDTIKAAGAWLNDCRAILKRTEPK